MWSYHSCRSILESLEEKNDEKFIKAINENKDEINELIPPNVNPSFNPISFFGTANFMKFPVILPHSWCGIKMLHYYILLLRCKNKIGYKNCWQVFSSFFTFTDAKRKTNYVGHSVLYFAIKSNKLLIDYRKLMK